MSNKSDGNAFEERFAKELAKHGYWVHRLAQNQAGQPADIIAAKWGYASLIDCKFCSGAYFTTKRIQENQRQAMKLWSDCFNGTGYFAVQFGTHGTIYMVPLFMLDDETATRLPQQWFRENADTLQEWIADDDEVGRCEQS